MPHLPENPSLDHLRRQARTLLRQFRAADAEALALLREHHPRPHDPLRLADAQLVVARSYGFPSWPALRRHMDVGRALRPLAAHRAAERGRRRRAAAPGLCALRRRQPRRPGPRRRAPGRAPGAVRRDPLHRRRHRRRGRRTGVPRRRPAAANRTGGPFGWEPLLYLAYSRIGGDALPVARLLLDHGADPNAGYLWEGTYPFTALTGAFGGGEDRGNQPPHPQGLALARLLLEAGADPNDSQTLYNRQFEPDDAHLRLLIEFGLGPTGAGRGTGCCAADHGTPPSCWRTSCPTAAPRSTGRAGRSWRWPPAPTPTAAGTAHPDPARPHAATRSPSTAGTWRWRSCCGPRAATAPPLDDVEEFFAAVPGGRPRDGAKRLRRPTRASSARAPGAAARCGAAATELGRGDGGAPVRRAGLRRARRAPAHAVAPGGLRRQRRARRAAAGAGRRPHPARPLLRRHAAGLGRAQPPGRDGRAPAPAHPRRPPPRELPELPPRQVAVRRGRRRLPAAWGQPAGGGGQRAAGQHAGQVAAVLLVGGDVGGRVGALVGQRGGVRDRRARASAASVADARSGVAPMLASATRPSTTATATIAQSFARRVNFS